jgi:FAD/FMN-containing dehydrogenase
MATAFQTANKLDTLRAAIPASTLNEDSASCAFYAQDVFVEGAVPAAIFTPTDIDMLAAGITAATSAGLAIIPRGGGMSYTGGYVGTRADAILIDMRGMTRILDINTSDMTVTVEAGCSWHALYEALHPMGLRTPLWGTLSGIKAAIGGGASQNGTFWGARNGSIAANILSYRVVLADGRIMDTGKDFFRPYGPDITGIFGGDAGALGVKAHITLPLMHEAKAFAYGSFAFDTPEDYCTAMSEIARRGLASESFGFDPFLQAQRMKRDSLASDAKSLVNMMKAQGGFWSAMKEGAKVVAAGRSFLDDATFSIHCLAEGRIQAAADADMREISDIVAQHHGRAVENTIPKVLRANPFPPVNSMAGPDGGRWLPVHGIVPHSKALDTISSIISLFVNHRADMERLDVGAGYMFLTVGATGFLIEPCFYWPDELWALHEDSIEPAHLAKLNRYPANPESRALVQDLRSAVIDILRDMGGMHFQIGRTYPLKGGMDPRAWSLLKTIKADLDPQGLMNPGALGL